MQSNPLLPFKLRQVAAWFDSPPPPPAPPPVGSWTALLREAANEIEMLQKEITETRARYGATAD